MALKYDFPDIPEPGSVVDASYSVDGDVVPTGPTDPMDPAPLEALFDRFRVEIDKMANQAQGFMVTDQKTSARAAEMAAQCRKLANRIEKQRVEVKAPYLAVTSRVDALCRQIRQHLGQIERNVNEKHTEFLRKLELKRQEAEAARQAEIIKQRLAEEKARRDAEAANKPAPLPKPVYVPPPVPEKTEVKTDSGTTKLEYEQVPVVNDLKALPDACFKAREKQITGAVMPWIRAQIKAGIYEIAGVTITKQPVVKTRVK